MQMDALEDLLDEYGIDRELFPPPLVAAAIQGLAFSAVQDHVAGYDTRRRGDRGDGPARRSPRGRAAGRPLTVARRGKLERSFKVWFRGSMATTRPIRFGFTGGASSKREKLIDSARAVEAIGYSTFGLADHFVRPFAPLIAGQAVADATTSLRMTQTVLAQDFREPAVLAKELATLDVLSEGRLQVGSRRRVAASGVRGRQHALRRRIGPDRRLEETAIILKGLFADGPFSFTGEHFRSARCGGHRTGPAATAADHDRRRRQEGAVGRGTPGRHRAADAEQPGGGTGLDPSQFSAEAIEEKIGWIQEAAGARFDEIELSAQLLECAVTDRPEEHLADFADRIAMVTERMGGARVDLGER